MAENKTHFRPDYAVPPGWILEEILDANEMSHAEFARRCGRSPKLVSEIISGKAPVEPETAIQFERVLGMNARVWLNIEANYQLHRAKEVERDRLVDAVEWSKRFPIKQLVKLDIVAKSKSELDTVQDLLAFFGVANVDAWTRRFAGASVSYRHSPTFESSIEALTTWLRLGEIAAEHQECGDYDRAAFVAVLKKIRGLSTDSIESFLPTMTTLCNEVGVAFVLVPSLPKTALSGAARWLTPRKALIQQSVRYLSNDHFWFTFFHEAAHILLHSRKSVFVDEATGDGTELEREANEWAANFLVSRHDWQAFIVQQPRSKTLVTTFAEEQRVAPGIIVGMLQHEGLLPWTHLNGLKKRYRWNQENHS